MSDPNVNPGADDAAAQAAAAAAAEAAAKPTTPAAADLDLKPQVIVQPTGDPAVDIAYRFLAEKGILPGSTEWDAAQKGDFSILKATLASKGVKGGAEYVAILEGKATAAATAEAGKKAATQKAVHEAAGGQEQWNALKEFAAEHAEDHELESINAGIKAGGWLAKAVVEALRTRYERFTGEAAVPSIPLVRGPSTPSVQPLSHEDYRAEMQKLSGKLGARMEASPEYASLRARRSAAIAAQGGIVPARR